MHWNAKVEYEVEDWPHLSTVDADADADVDADVDVDADAAVAMPVAAATIGVAIAVVFLDWSIRRLCASKSLEQTSDWVWDGSNWAGGTET